MATSTPAKPKGAIAIALAMLLGLGVVIANNQAVLTTKPPGSTTTTTSTTSTTTMTGVTTTTAPGATTTTGASTTTTTTPSSDPWLMRFTSPTASWNKPVSQFGAATGYLASLKDRFWLYAGYPAAPGSFNVAFQDYSVPIHDLRTATSTNTVRAFMQQEYQSTSAFFDPAFNHVQIGDYIPWNDQWQHGTGNDRLMMAVNPATGEYWGYNGTDLPLSGLGTNQCIDRGFPPFIPNGPNTNAGFNESNPNHKCFYTMGRNTVTAGTAGNAYTITDGATNTERGAGINKLIGITRAIEVDQGVIAHALEFTVTSTMFGQPLCSPAKGFSDTRAQGGGCGFYLAPATRVEFTQDPTNRCGNSTENGQINPQTYNSPTVANRLKTVPEGMRLAINITDPQIENWLDSRGYTGAKRRTAKIFAVAMRDYGAIILETGCWGINLETDGILDTRTGGSRDIWARNGITAISGNANPHGDLLAGLITQSNLYVVNPPPG